MKMNKYGKNFILLKGVLIGVFITSFAASLYLNKQFIDRESEMVGIGYSQMERDDFNAVVKAVSIPMPKRKGEQ